MRALFTTTLFLSAALLFLVQPMVARLVLPLLGGTPAVWNTCMVFFQAVLLAGYAYAHAAPAWLGVRRHAVLHVAALLLPFLVLPIEIPVNWPSPDSNHPIPWLLGLLLAAVGLPFFAVSTSAPLLQRWFAATGDPAARDPYFLYAASNLGSLLALLAYPFLLEPTLRLANQAWLWAAGYGLLVSLTLGCAIVVWRSQPPAATVKQDASSPPDVLPSFTRLRWVFLAFIPSSLMLSVTTYLTTDIAAVPLLWVVPLSLYLLTFVLTFARRAVPLAGFARWMPLVVLIVVIVMLTEATEPIGLVVCIHLLLLFWVGMVCHGTLAAHRPAARRLTEFYLWLSVGGVLGGLFNGLAAPLVFSSIAEYPVVLVLACLALSRQESHWKPRAVHSSFEKMDFVLPAGLGLLTVALIFIARALEVPAGPPAVGLSFGLPLVLCYTLSERPLRFGLGLGALLLASTQSGGVSGRVEYRERSFFGAHRVTLDASGEYRKLLHGNTIHGMQSLDPGREREPLTYYHRTGPIGQAFAGLHDDERLQQVGLVGLGAGALACYGQPGQEWEFLEIDPAVIHIAREKFTYVRTCLANLAIIPGDARLTLARRDRRYGFLVIDAFSSDAIPVHLLTREAMTIYRSRLSENGLIAFNISNRYLDLRPVLAGLARDAGMVCYAREDLSLTAEERQDGKSPSHWVMVAPSRAAAGAIATDRLWEEVKSRPSDPVWTDDFSNLLRVFKWP